MSPSESPRILQLCHGYDGPFLDCARQYAVLFEGTAYKVTTVFITGEPDPVVARGAASDEVIFLGYRSSALTGLKLKVIRDVRRLVKRGRFRLCIAHRFKPTYIACLATGLPVIGVNHAFGVYAKKARRLFASLFRKRLLLLGVSNAVRDDIRRALPTWPAERIETLYNRINIEAVQAEQVSRAEARDRLGLPHDAWVIGNVGRLHPDKDQATLIRGFAQALPLLPPGTLLAIMGKGRLEHELKLLSCQLGVAGQVRFLGQVSNGRRYFKAFDLFALTSDHEPFGMVLLEAMAAGVPAICSNVGGGAEVAGPANLFTHGDVDSLAHRLVEAARNAKPGNILPALTERFSDEVASDQFWRLAGVHVILPCAGASR